MAPGVRRVLLADALNYARSANILNEDDPTDVVDLINEYFTAELTETEDETDTSDEETDNDQAVADEAIDEVIEDSNSLESDDSADSETEPIVHVTFEPLVLDINSELYKNMDPDVDWERVKSFSCKCKLKVVSSETKQNCFSQFSKEEVLERRMNMAELTEAEKDMLILGVLSGLPMSASAMTIRKPCRSTERKQQKTTYMIDSKVVCRDTFKFLFGISQNKLTALLDHFRKNGVVPREKKWGGRKFNKNSFSSEDTERAVQFLRTFAEDHALVLPGRVPGFKRADVKLLSSSETKASIWRQYQETCIAAGHRAAGKSTFLKLWKAHVPFIVVARPMTDLCWRCQQNNTKIHRTANLPEDEKMNVLGEQIEHLRIVKAERDFYNRMVKNSKEAAAAAGLSTLSRHDANSLDRRIHYSFDFAQQLHYPSNPMQPGPVYFLVPRKCGVFGICCEALPQQINYLIDEGMCSSKGSNIVLSLLHHFLEHYALGEKDVDFHCDNCSGQNKNRFMLWYMAWRVMTGRHTSITVNFMPAGHTKFAPDWCFGLFKRKFKRTEVHCLADIADVADRSTTRNINRAQLVGTEDGVVNVPVYNWQDYLKPWFQPLKGIKSLQHFRFGSATPGVVHYKKTLDDVEQAFQLGLPGPGPSLLTDMPVPVAPPGLPEERRRYLRKSIRPFVRQDVQDLVCP